MFQASCKFSTAVLQVACFIWHPRSEVLQSYTTYVSRAQPQQHSELFQCRDVPTCQRSPETHKATLQSLTEQPSLSLPTKSSPPADCRLMNTENAGVGTLWADQTPQVSNHTLNSSDRCGAGLIHRQQAMPTSLVLYQIICGWCHCWMVIAAWHVGHSLVFI